MEISVYFEPLDIDLIQGDDIYQPSQLGRFILKNTNELGFPSCENAQLAIIGVKEDRNAVNNSGCANAPDRVREELYKLFQGNYNLNIVDLGNIKSGNEITDTYFALSHTCTELIKRNILPVIIGGSNDLAFANYVAYINLEQLVNVVSIDSSFDIGATNAPFNARTFISKILLHQPNVLFNYSNIGYQTYFVDQEAITLMEKLFFDSYRLGVVRKNIEDTEPIVRNADMVSFDLSSVRYADAPGNGNASPNGFYGEEVCQIARYVGLSERVSSVGFYEMNPDLDKRNQTAQLVAQMIWYFIDGYANRKKDNPGKDKSKFMKYHVFLEENKYEIIFYKSKMTNRWWMEVPYPADKKTKYERLNLVPCSYNDYKTACDGEMPDRWWQAHQKLS